MLLCFTAQPPKLRRLFIYREKLENDQGGFEEGCPGMQS